jgi:hypothetical protein
MRLMDKVKNILKHMRIERASVKYKCSTNSRHSITAGDYYVMYEHSPGRRQHICALCAGEVFDEAEVQLAALRYSMLRICAMRQ